MLRAAFPVEPYLQLVQSLRNSRGGANNSDRQRDKTKPKQSGSRHEFPPTECSGARCKTITAKGEAKNVPITPPPLLQPCAERPPAPHPILAVCSHREPDTPTCTRLPT